MTCYICLEPCENQSPCECGAPAHLKCLLEYTIVTKQTHCSICKGDMDEFMAIMELLEVLPVTTSRPSSRRLRRINMASCVFLMVFIFSLTQVIYSYSVKGASRGVTYTDIVFFVLLVFPASSLLAACCSFADDDDDDDTTAEVDEITEPYQP